MIWSKSYMISYGLGLKIVGHHGVCQKAIKSCFLIPQRRLMLGNHIKYQVILHRT